jgi:dipeptidyl aminopeptidase/acylaminoacyl peptidase
VPINALAGWAESGQGAIGASLPARPEAYVENSPIYLADRIRTPVLLIEGDLDPAGGDVLFGALYRLGREADLVTYAGEGHVFVSPANLRDLHARILAWLDRYLGPAELGDAPRAPGPAAQVPGCRHPGHASGLQSASIPSS